MPAVQVKRRRKRVCHSAVAVAAGFVYYASMWRLTWQEQKVLLVVIGLLLVGWAVKAYRTTHPPAASKIQWQPS